MKLKNVKHNFIAKCLMAWLFFALFGGMLTVGYSIARSIIEQHQNEPVSESLDLPEMECDPLDDDCVSDTDGDLGFAIRNSLPSN